MKSPSAERVIKSATESGPIVEPSSTEIDARLERPEAAIVVAPVIAPPALTPTATTAPAAETVKLLPLTSIPASRLARPLSVAATATMLPSTSTVKSSFVLIPPSRLERPDAVTMPDDKESTVVALRSPSPSV